MTASTKAVSLGKDGARRQRGDEGGVFVLRIDREKMIKQLLDIADRPGLNERRNN